jgi:cytoskeletal protein RodZ
MVRRAAPLLLALGLFALPVHAQRKKAAEYHEPTEAEQALQKRSRTKVLQFREAKEELEENAPFPWGMVGIALLAFGIAVPFAVRAFRQMETEVSEAQANQEPPAPRRPRRAKTGALPAAPPPEEE